MFFKNLTPQQRLNRAVLDLMSEPSLVALAGILMIGNREIVKGEELARMTKSEHAKPTVATNGRDEWWSEDFIKSIGDSDLRFAVLHEAYHKMYRHLTTWQNLFKENKELADYAADFVVNGQIKHLLADNKFNKQVTLPEDALYAPQFDNMNVHQVYLKLKQLMPPPPPSGGSGKNKGDGSGGGQPPPGGGGEQEGDGDGEGQEQGGDGNKPGKGKGKPKPDKGKGGKGNNPMDGKNPMDSHLSDEAQELTPQEKDALEREIDAAIRQGALMAGKMGTGGLRELDDLMQAKVNWKEALRDFVNSVYAGNDFSTWRRPNRRYIGMGHYMPSGISERLGELVIAIDTSGSIDQHTLTMFLSEVADIVKAVNPEFVRVLYWDTAVAREEKYGGPGDPTIDELVRSTKPAGGGGTMVECVCEHMQKHNIKPQAAIIFTDGYLGGSWGTWSVPTLWCIKDNRSTYSPVGVTVHIDSSDM